jgi:hypothetical protein
VTLISAEELQLATDVDLSSYVGPISSDMSPTYVAGLLQRQCMAKKFLDSNTITQEAEQEALRRLKESNSLCQEWSFKPNLSLDEMILGDVSSLMDSFFFPDGLGLLSLTAIAERFGVGPGANVGATKDNSFIGKVFNGPMSCTDRSLYRMYELAISRSPRWSAAEKRRCSTHGLRVVHGEKWSAVPKTSVPAVARGIGTQPLLNMLFQKGIGIALEERLKTRFHIDLSAQPDLNKRLALEGSIGNSFATVDLKEASNSISLALCKEILPASQLAWLLRTRCARTTLPSGEGLDLYILSGMGNGYTFPLQTAIFASIAITAMRHAGITPIYNVWCKTWRRWIPGNFGVFGDDIIVPSQAYGMLHRALVLLGFRVNDDKSFFAGRFRESCGGDYFSGHDVRPVYCKSLATQQDVYSLFNRTIRWSAKHGIALDATWTLLRSRISQRKLLTVPFTEGDTGGFKVPYFSAVGQASDRNTHSIIYRACVPKASEVDLTRQKHAKERLGYHGDTNYHGTLVALLGGFVRNNRITLIAKGAVRYIVRWRLVPSWDWIPEADLTRDQGERWKALAAVEFNKLNSSTPVG